MSSYKSFGLIIRNPIKKGEIIYSSSIQDELWEMQQKTYELEMEMDRIMSNASYKKIHNEVFEQGNNIKQLPVNKYDTTITYDKDGNAEITIEI